MSVPKIALRRIYRILQRLTRDVDKICASNPPTSLGVLLKRVESKQSIHGMGIYKIRDTEDLRCYIRGLFRNSPATSAPPNELIGRGIQGIQSMNQLLHILKHNVMTCEQDSTGSLSPSGTAEIDDSWVDPYVQQVEWLPSVLGTVKENDRTTVQKEVGETIALPLFPLSGSLFVSKANPLPILGKHSHWQYPTPGTERTLHISEPRYRQLYGDLLSQSEEDWIFAVPFCHPTLSGVFATHAFVYQLTHVQEIADETNGAWQYICQHKVLEKPVRLHKILNPHEFKTQDSYLRVEASWLDQSLDRPLCEHRVTLQSLNQALDGALDSVVITAFLADECKAVLQKLDPSAGNSDEILWAFVRTWLTGLQQRLLRLELQVSARVKRMLRSELKSVYDNDNDAQLKQRSAELLKNIQKERRNELLQLKLDTALGIPRVLQGRSIDRRLEIMLDLVRNAIACKN